MKNGAIDLNSKEMLELVEAAKQGDKRAFSQVAVLLTPVVRAHTRRMFVSNGLEGDDLFQEGMFGVFKAIKNYDASRGASFLTYVNLCIRSKLLSATGGMTGDSTVSLDEELLPVDGSRNNYAYLELMDFIRDRLTAKEFATLKLFLSGYSYAQIAEKQGSTVKAVDGTLQRVRKKLREYFD